MQAYDQSSHSLTCLQTTAAMDSLLFITIATLLASTDGLNQIQLPPTVIPGQYETCPPQDILEMARQNLSARVNGLISRCIRTL